MYLESLSGSDLESSKSLRKIRSDLLDPKGDNLIRVKLFVSFESKPMESLLFVLYRKVLSIHDRNLFGHLR